jgi:type II secretory pathway component PulF
MTQVLLDISHWLLARHGLNALLLISPVILIAGFRSVSSLHNRFRRKNSDNQWIFATAGDFIKWHLPFLHWFEMSYSLMRLAAILRVGLASGHPVDVTISQACGLNVNTWFRRRIRKWLKCVQCGDSISSSAMKCGIGHSVAWAFDEEINAGNTPEILQMLENFHRENFSYRLNIARAVFGPFVVLALGGCVWFVAFAMFLPIISIIGVLTESVVP